MSLSFEYIIQGEVPVVVDFFAECCEPSLLMQSILHDVKSITGSMVTVLKMNISKHQFYAKKYNIKSFPTVMIFKMVIFYGVNQALFLLMRLYIV